MIRDFRNTRTVLSFSCFFFFIIVLFLYGFHLYVSHRVDSSKKYRDTDYVVTW